MSDSERLKEVAPLPWKSYKIRSRPHLYRLVDGQDLTVLLVPGKENTGTGDRAKEIAGYVLHAANDYEKLLAACKIAEEAVRTAIPQEAVRLIHEQGDFDALCIARIRLEEAISAAERGKS